MQYLSSTGVRMRGDRSATRHPTRDSSTFKRRSLNSPGPASRLLQPSGPVTEASHPVLLTIRCCLCGVYHRALATRITSPAIASHPCRHGLREKFPDEPPRLITHPAPEQIGFPLGCLPFAYIALAACTSQYHILIQPDTHLFTFAAQLNYQRLTTALTSTIPHLFCPFVPNTLRQ